MKTIHQQTLFVDEVINLIHPEKQHSDHDLKPMIQALVDQYLQPDISVQSREVTILLSDIRGFTALAEKYSATQVVDMLNNYFSSMNAIINRYDGMIDKYMGDAILVVFGLNGSSTDAPERAISCAVEMQLAMDEVNRINRSQGLPDLFAGIGINTGAVSAGRLGSDIHEEFTVIGDGVNLASRIESYSLRGQVLISEHTYCQVEKHVDIGSVNTVHVKGKTGRVKLYEVKAIDFHSRLQVPDREIRNSMRVEIDTPFRFQMLDGKTVLPELYQGLIKDISYDGVFAVVELPIDNLSNIKFKLALSLLGGEQKDIYGKIVSVRKITGGYGCGIEFTGLDDESRASIKRFIDRIIEGT